MSDLICSYNANAPLEVRKQQIDAILSSLPRQQRRPIEDFFSYLTEKSISEEMEMAREGKGFSTMEEYEASLKGGHTPRTLALLTLWGNSSKISYPG
jgi:hypothetical protein